MRVGALEVLPKIENVGNKEKVGVVVIVGVTGNKWEVSVLNDVDVNVGAETISENATTVSTMTVLMLETRKSTTPMFGVPTWAAALISLTPTTAAPHSRLKPRAAATTTHISGR